MTTALALEYIPKRMKELGYGADYILRFRHFVLQPSEQIELDGFNQLFILVEEATDVTIDSAFGLYDASVENVNEQIYEHQGQIFISNYANGINHLRFIQVIPKHPRHDTV